MKQIFLTLLILYITRCARGDEDAELSDRSSDRQGKKCQYNRGADCRRRGGLGRTGVGHDSRDYKVPRGTLGILLRGKLMLTGARNIAVNVFQF